MSAVIDAATEKLRQINPNQQQSTPAAKAPLMEIPDATNVDHLEEIDLSRVKPEDVEWSWPDRLALGTLHCLSGPYDMGKSTMFYDWTARVTTGKPWPNEILRREPGRVLLMTSEDSVSKQIRPKIDAASGDPSKVIILPSVIGANKRFRTFSFEKDLHLLEEKLQKYPDTKMFIVDPIMSYLGRANQNNEGQVRGITEPLSRLAEKYNIIAMYMIHHGKPNGDARSANHRAIGSQAWVAAARIHLSVLPDRDDEFKKRRYLTMPKNNLTAKNKDELSIAYKIVSAPSNQKVGLIEWEFGTVNISADDAAGSDESQNVTKLQEIQEWLGGLIAINPLPVPEIERLASLRGYAWNTVRKAKTNIKTIHKQYRINNTPVYFWGNPACVFGGDIPATANLLDCLSVSPVPPVSPYQ